MWPKLPFQPDQASTIARSVDHLYFFLTGITLFFSALIFLTILYFAVKYRRRSEDERPPEIEGSLVLELSWTLIPALLTVVIFVWSSSLYFENSRPPLGSTEIFVVGKQWMWHLQHPEGRREINELHVPVGVPVKLTMTSEDVIHDFFIPAFRVKKDVLPGRYSSIWFEATEPGSYHFFCAQYCGAEHSGMIGWVYVMAPADYAQWLSGSAPGGETMEAAGAQLFEKFACGTCHVPDGSGRGPSLNGVYGKPVRLVNGQTVTADESYLRDCILTPSKRPLAGYPPLMPTFQGQLSEEQILQVIAYIKSLAFAAAPAPRAEAASAKPSQEAPQPAGAPSETAESPGAKLFIQFTCQTCHVAAGGGIGPSLVGVYGKPVRLTNGQTVPADEAYLRDCILTPTKRPLAGFPPMMPSFQGRLTDEQVSQLIDYIKSLSSSEGKPMQ
jgi:cytochrome c oxidase subunit 2